MTVKELKEILNKEDDDTEVTIAITSDNWVDWKKLECSWHTVGGMLVLGNE